MMRAFCRTSSRALRSSRSREIYAATVRPAAKIRRNTRLNLTISFMTFPPRFPLLSFLRLLGLRRPVLLLLFRMENGVPLGVRREILEQLCPELGVLGAALEALDQVAPERRARLQPGLDLRVSRVVLALGVGAPVAQPGEERCEVVAEIRGHRLDEIGRGTRRDGERLAVAPHDEFPAFQVAAAPRRAAPRQLDDPGSSRFDEQVVRIV